MRIADNEQLFRDVLATLTVLNNSLFAYLAGPVEVRKVRVTVELDVGVGEQSRTLSFQLSYFVSDCSAFERLAPNCEETRGYDCAPQCFKRNGALQFQGFSSEEPRKSGLTLSKLFGALEKEGICSSRYVDVLENKCLERQVFLSPRQEYCDLHEVELDSCTYGLLQGVKLVAPELLSLNRCRLLREECQK